MKNIKITIAALLCTTIFVTGCITPRYESVSKDKVSADLYRNVYSTDTTTIADLSWEEYYTDDNLKSLIREALDSNLNLRSAVNNIEQASQYFKQSRSAIAPTVGAGLNVTRAGGGVYSMDYKNPIMDYKLALSASWEIDVWGKLRSAKQAAYARLLQQVAVKNSVVTQLVSDVASSYYQLLMLDAQLEVTLRTIDNYTEYLETVKVMKESAMVNEVAVQQAKAQLYGARAMLPQLVSNIEVTENYICMLLSKTPQKIKRASSINLDAINFDAKVGVASQLLSNRPDVIAAENALRASHWSFNQARASLYPSLTIAGNIGYESTNIKEWFDPASLFWNLVGGLTQPLFNGKALRVNRNIAELQKSQSLLNFENTLLQSSLEVSNSISMIKATTLETVAKAKQVKALSKACEDSEMLLKSGYANYLDVLVAQTGLFNTEISLYQTYYNVLKYKIELYRALGGGWN